MFKAATSPKSPVSRIIPFFDQKGTPSSAPAKMFDAKLFFTTLFLVLCGVVVVFSASAHLAKDMHGDIYYFLKREIIYLLIGMTGLFIAKSIPYRLYARFIYPFLGVILFLLFLSFLPGISHSAKGATRWINVLGFTFQPSELAKLAVVIFVAYLTAKKGPQLQEFWKGFLPVMGVAGIFILAILAQKDLGSAFVLSSVIFIMLYVAGTRVRYLAGAVILAIPALYLLVFSVAFRRQRIMAFLDPWKYQLDSGFQIIQSFVAFKSGGLTGVGMAEGKQKLFYLPEAHTDFIFSVVGEEFGWIGVSVIATAFLIFVYRGLRIARECPNPFGMLLATGITCLIGLMAFINFSVVMGILPTKGLTLPFISYGGSSLIVCLYAVGILLNISSQREE